MIQPDFGLNQGEWLVNNVEDIQSHGGVCHAMTTEWLLAKLQNLPWDANSEYWRGVSHQRAYALPWQEALKGLWGGINYHRYLQIALPSTEQFVQAPALRLGQSFNTIHFTVLNQISLQILTLHANSGGVIVMFGSNAAWPADKQNWGHTTAVVREADGVFRFLDVNQGQFSWPLIDTAEIVSLNLIQNLVNNYGNWGIRDIYFFRIG